MSRHIGIVITEVGPDFVRATLPVDERTRQPMGRLHGGASVALAETLMSAAAGHAVDRTRFSVVGLEINANHLRAASEGLVTATARPVHLGRSTQVWCCEVVDAEDRPVCVSRMTVAVIDREKP